MRGAGRLRSSRKSVVVKKTPRRLMMVWGEWGITLLALRVHSVSVHGYPCDVSMCATEYYSAKTIKSPQRDHISVANPCFRKYVHKQRNRILQRVHQPQIHQFIFPLLNSTNNSVLNHNFPFRVPYFLRVTTTLKFSCFMNQSLYTFHSLLGSANARSKRSTNSAISLLSSISEMFLPMHVRGPRPNY